MSRTDFIYPNLDSKLVAKVDTLVNHLKKNGNSKYANRRHFITLAIDKLLQEETHTIKVNNTEVIA